MGLYYMEKNEDGAVLSIWEQREPVCRKEKREKELLMEESLLRLLFGTGQKLDHYPNGQPFLPNRPDHISIAHTNRFGVVLVHPQKRVGVDMECLDRNFSAVECRALSNREVGFLSPNQNLRCLQLAILWSAKEALFKCVSQEGVDFARHMQVEPFVPQESGNLYARFFYKDGGSALFFLKYRIIDNHVLTFVCA